MLIMDSIDLYATFPAAYATERRPRCCYAFLSKAGDTGLTRRG
jgi:hypothetical protein